jgi:hypothetical protein
MMRLFIVLSGLALTLAACGGAASPVAQAPATTAGSAASVAASSQSTATNAASGGPNIADVLKAGKTTTYKATYTWTVAAGGQTTTSEQTWFYKAPNSRFDYSLGQSASFSIYSLADGTYICTNAGATFCQKAAGQAAFGQNPAADFAFQLQADPSKFNASFTGSQTIAGQQAQCYKVQSVAGSFGDVSTCYSSTGVPLKTTIASSGSTVTMEATAFSTTVTDADFALPAAVR